MRQYDSISTSPPHTFRLVMLLLILLGLNACATPPSSDELPGSTPDEMSENSTYWFLHPPSTDSTPKKTPDSTAANDADDTPQNVTETADAPRTDSSITTEPAGTEPSAPATEAAQAEPALTRPEPVTKPVLATPESEPATQEPATALAETEPVTMGISCKNLPYSEYEKQARASIAKGLSATTAGTYGVGFRNLDEHKKWNETHKALFTAVNQACIALSECTKQHPEDKTTQCANEARQFDEWQNLAADFAEKAKQSETTQPPKICSFTADLDDAARCFHALADNIDNTCNTSECKETSDCWRGIGFLDGAINQAASACTFVRTPLAECRGYVTATQRRKNKFERCAKMQEGLNTRIIPVL